MHCFDFQRRVAGVLECDSARERAVDSRGPEFERFGGWRESGFFGDA
jgi:hypothetical protein